MGLRCTANKVYRVQRCCWIDLGTSTEPSNHQYWNCSGVDQEMASRKVHAEERWVTYSSVNMGSCHKSNCELASSSTCAGAWEKWVSFYYHRSGRAGLLQLEREGGAAIPSKAASLSVVGYFILGLRTTIFAILMKILELGTEVCFFLSSSISLVKPVRVEVCSWALTSIEAQGSKGWQLGRKATSNSRSEINSNLVRW